MTIRGASEIEQERLAFKRDRYGHNHSSAVRELHVTRITYLAHGKGYVMARRPQCTPFVLTEKQWLAFPNWEGQADT